MQETRYAGSIPELEDPLEEGMELHSSILTWRIPWTEKPGRLWSIGSQRVGYNWRNLAHTQDNVKPCISKCYKIIYMFIITFICYVNPVVTFKNSVLMYETIPFNITWKRKKYLGKIYLSKQKIRTLKTKAVMKKIEDDTNRWKDIPCSWIGRINIVNMSILPKAITDSMQSLSNYQHHFSQN